MDINTFFSDESGQGEAVFKLALVVIIIAAILAVLSYVMGGAWKGSEELAKGTEQAAKSVNESLGKLFQNTSK
jgi:uncharacterized protein (UPF0333 family)